MSKTRKNPKTAKRRKKKSYIKISEETGLPVLSSGKTFTKEDVARDFPDETDRDSKVLRRSVGL